MCKFFNDNVDDNDNCFLININFYSFSIHYLKKNLRALEKRSTFAPRNYNNTGYN